MPTQKGIDTHMAPRYNESNAGRLMHFGRRKVFLKRQSVVLNVHHLRE